MLTFAAMPACSQSATETTLYNFQGATDSNVVDGSVPLYSLIQAADGNFYGTTSNSGAGPGTIFRISPFGLYQLLHYTSSDTNAIVATNLVQGGNGLIYGVSIAPGYGSVFTLDPQCSANCELTTIYAFTYNEPPVIGGDGAGPASGLTLGSGGNFYGTTLVGGDYQCGTIYEISAAGVYSTLYSFPNCSTTDFEGPNGALVQASDGNLYGTADGLPLFLGGTSHPLYHYVYELQAPFGQGNFATTGTLDNAYLYGYAPTPDISALVEGPDANLYGNQQVAGPTDELDGAAAFKGGLGISGGATSLYQYANEDVEGGAFTVGSDGELYGTTVDGYFFKLNTSGDYQVLYNFGAGYAPYAAPVQGSDGNFYGVTSTGGTCVTCGIIYKITPVTPLAPPVQLSLSATSVAANTPVTLNWTVSNAFSLTMQQCYAFVQNQATGAGNWTGLQTGTMSKGVLSGSAKLTPTEAGLYVYALTCGGVESGFAVLDVGGALAATATSVTSNSPVALGTTVDMNVAIASPYEPVVGPPTGKVTLTYSGVLLGTVSLINGAATLELEANDSTPLGTYQISASYSGDAHYHSSTGTANVTVVGYQTLPVLTISPTNVIQGQSTTFSASVSRVNGSGAPTGSIKFYYDSMLLGTVPLVSGVATLHAQCGTNIPAGTYAITAVYSGDSSDQSSTSAAVNVVVTAPTITTADASPNPVGANSVVTLTADVQEVYGTETPTGTITFYFGDFDLGSATLGSGGVTINLSDAGISPGTYSVVAKYSGDTYNEPSSKTFDVTVQ